jgi:hypothetical protein
MFYLSLLIYKLNNRFQRAMVIGNLINLLAPEFGI